MPHTLGDKTRSAIICGPESHKLFLEFSKAEATVIEAGTPVTLDPSNAGEILAATSGAAMDDIIGYSVTGKNHTAYGENLVTIACRGFMVVIGKASGTVPPGPVEFDTVDSEGINVFGASTSPAKTVGWAIVGNTTGLDIEVLLF